MNKILHFWNGARSRATLLYVKCAGYIRQNPALHQWLISLIRGLAIGTVMLGIADGFTRLSIGNRFLNTIVAVTVSYLMIIGIPITAWVRRALKYRRNKKALEELWIKQQALVSNEQIPTSLRVYSALQQVLATDGQDKESLRTVINWAIRMKLVNGFKPCKAPKVENKSSLWGEHKAPEPCMANKHKIHVGGFKAWRGIDLIFFQEYWRSDFTTPSDWTDPYRGWTIAFHPETLEPRFFGTLGFREYPDAPTLYGIIVISGEHAGMFCSIGVYP